MYKLPKAIGSKSNLLCKFVPKLSTINCQLQCFFFPAIKKAPEKMEEKAGCGAASSALIFIAKRIYFRSYKNYGVEGEGVGVG